MAAVLGIIIDMPVISVVAIFKGPYMLFKGWKHLFHDLIGHEGPFLRDNMCSFYWPCYCFVATSCCWDSSGICVSQFRSWWICKFYNLSGQVSVDTIVTNLL